MSTAEVDQRPYTADVISALLLNIGDVKLPPGEIILTESIVWPIGAGARLQGSGFATRLHCTGDFPAITLVGATRSSKATIRDLRITRTNTLAAVANQHQSDGIRVWGDDILIEDCWIEDCYKGVHVIDTAAVSTKVALRRLRITHGSPTAFNSHSGIYLTDVDKIEVTDCPSSTTVQRFLFRDTGITNIKGVARYYEFLAPAAGTTTAVHAAVAGSAANVFPGPITQPAFPRGLTVTFAAGWDGGDVVITGVNQYGETISVTVPSAPGTTANTSAVFASVTSIAKTVIGVAADAASVGTNNRLGIPDRMVSDTGVILQVDATVEAPGATSSTNGYTTPTTAPNGARNFRVIANTFG